MKGWNSHGYLVNEILISMRFLRNDVFYITDTTQYISQWYLSAELICLEAVHKIFDLRSTEYYAVRPVSYALRQMPQIHVANPMTNIGNTAYGVESIGMTWF